MKSIEEVELVVTEEDLAELRKCHEESVGEYIIDRVQEYCDTILEMKLSPDVLMAALLQVYCEVAEEHGDRATYMEQLNYALEEQWEPVTLH